MAAIGSRTFNLIEDRYLTLANEEFLRPLSIGNNWSKLRLGAMLALPPNGTNNLTGCSLMLGICSAANPFANTAGFAAASTTNFIGLDLVTDSSGNPASGVFTYNAGSGNPYYSVSSACARRRVGTTDSVAVATALAHAVTQTTGTLARRTLHYVEITKGSPSYTVKYYAENSTLAVMDFTEAHFLDGLEQSGTPTVNGQSLFASSVMSLACDESAGVFDTVNLFWNRSQFPLEVYALAAFRMA
jgi:hypothetical protein